jgi:hypothetical protein
MKPILAAAFLLAIALPAHAQVEGARINGSLDSTVVLNGDATTQAAAFATANTNIGVIDGSTINGSVKQYVGVGSVVTSASSLYSNANTQIGTLLDSTSNGAIDRTISVGNVITTARQVGASAETRIGTVENARVTGFNQTIIIGEVVTDSNTGAARTCIGTIKGANSWSGRLETGNVASKNKQTNVDARGC